MKPVITEESTVSCRQTISERNFTGKRGDVGFENDQRSQLNSCCWALPHRRVHKIRQRADEFQHESSTERELEKGNVVMRDRKHGNGARTIWLAVPVLVARNESTQPLCTVVGSIFMKSIKFSRLGHWRIFTIPLKQRKAFLIKFLWLRYVPAPWKSFISLSLAPSSMSKLYQDVLCPFSGLNFHLINDLGRQSRLTETGIRAEIDFFCWKHLLCDAFEDTTFKTLMAQHFHDDTSNLQHFNAAT